MQYLYIYIYTRAYAYAHRWLFEQLAIPRCGDDDNDNGDAASAGDDDKGDGDANADAPLSSGAGSSGQFGLGESNSTARTLACLFSFESCTSYAYTKSLSVDPRNCADCTPNTNEIASIKFDFPLPFGPMIEVNFLNGPMICFPLYDLKFSSSMRRKWPNGGAFLVVLLLLLVPLSLPGVPGGRGGSAGCCCCCCCGLLSMTTARLFG